MNQTSFSMQNILNQPIDPVLCKRILQSIKSPLLEQSFALTNDESLNNSYINPPKRPDIPPTYQIPCYTRRPGIKNKSNTYGYGQQFYLPQSRYLTPVSNTQNFTYQGKIVKELGRSFQNRNDQNNINFQSRYQIQSIVSPLHPNITLKEGDKKNSYENIWQNICGNVFNLGNEKKYETIYEGQIGRYKRRKIFNQKSKSVLQKQREKNNIVQPVVSILLAGEDRSHISIKQNQDVAHIPKELNEVVEQLRRNKHYQVAQFLTLIASVINKLKRAQTQRKYLLQNMEIVYQLFQDEKQYQYFEKNENCNKFLRRMNFTSVFDMFKKISRSKLIKSKKNDLKQFAKQKNIIQTSLENMLKSFSTLQQLIEQFLRQRNSIQKLKKIYQILNEKFSKHQTKNSHQQLINLFRDVRLYNYEKEVLYLQYIWQTLNQKILTQQQFINGLIRSHGIYREQTGKQDISKFQNELSSLGFQKN